MTRRAHLFLFSLVVFVVACPEGDPADEPQESLDPLSMPAEPIWSTDQFSAAAECESCHPDHAAEWKLSRHAYAMVDPVFRELARRRQADLDGVEDQFCTQCHSSICARGGECVPGFSFEELSPISLEGITCEACHKVRSVERPYNSGHVIEPDAAQAGTIEDPVDNAYHASEYSALFETSEFCGACHDVVETSNLNLERPYAEWLQSPARYEGKNCQACHMPSYTGPAVSGGVERELHRHRFVGVEIPNIPEVYDNPELLAELDAEVAELLHGAASVRIETVDAVTAGQRLDVVVTVTNDIDAHAFPTGSTNLRQVWIEVVATDANGAELYHTGMLDSEGDLGNVWSTVAPHSDPDLVMLSSSLVDAAGQPTVFSWLAAEHETGSISPLHERTFTFFVPVPEDAAGPVEVDAVIHFRAYPPFLIRELGLTDQIGDALKTRDVAETMKTVDVLAARRDE